MAETHIFYHVKKVLINSYITKFEFLDFVASLFSIQTFVILSDVL
jgi:hypothetical protein